MFTVNDLVDQQTFDTRLFKVSTQFMYLEMKLHNILKSLSVIPVCEQLDELLQLQRPNKMTSEFIWNETNTQNKGGFLTKTPILLGFKRAKKRSLMFLTHN